MLNHPQGRSLDVLVHGRRNRTDHPAVSVAMSYLLANLLSLWRTPKLIPSLAVQVTHHLLILGTITWHHITVWVDEEGIETHIARQETLLTIDIVDESMVEVSTEPLLWRVRLQQFVHQVLEVLSHHRTVVDDVLSLNEVERVMERCGSELHTHLVAQLIERHEVRSVLVLNGHTEAHILQSHLAELLQGSIATVETIVQTTDFIVGLLQALDRDTDTYLRELLRQVDDTVGEETVGRDYDTVALLIKLTYDVLQVRTNERLTTRDVGKIHLRKFPDSLYRDFLLWLRRSLVTITHRATSVASIGHDDRTIQFLFCHNKINLLLFCEKINV